MKKQFLLFGMMSCTLFAAAQTKIGGTIGAADPNAFLQLGDTASNKGLLLSRVKLTATNLPAPLTAHKAGMVVYNTVAAGTGITAVTPGCYYNDGAQWVRSGAGTGTGTADWYKAGTTAAAANADHQYVTGNIGIGGHNGGNNDNTYNFSASTPDVPLIVVAPGNADTTIKAPVTGMRLAMPGVYGYKWPLSADFQIGSYATGLAAVSKMDIRLGNGGTAAPDVTVASFLGNGNVGIGVTNPQIAIDVNNNVKIGTSQTINNSHDPADRGVKLSVGAVVNNAPAEFTGMKIISSAGTNGCGNTSDVTFNTWECNTALSREVMRVNGTGNVGIGTAAPGAKLEVAGQVKITGGTPGVNKVLTSDSTGLATWKPAATDGDAWGVNGEDTTSNIKRTGEVRVGTGAKGAITLNNGGAANAGYLQILKSDGATRLGFIGYDNTNLTYVAENAANHVFSGGNVGVGTAAPGAKLEVAGQVKITGGAPGAGKLLTSDATGLATWEEPKVHIFQNSYDITTQNNLGTLPSNGVFLEISQTMNCYSTNSWTAAHVYVFNGVFHIVSQSTGAGGFLNQFTGDNTNTLTITSSVLVGGYYSCASATVPVTYTFTLNNGIITYSCSNMGYNNGARVSGLY